MQSKGQWLNLVQILGTGRKEPRDKGVGSKNARTTMEPWARFVRGVTSLIHDGSSASPVGDGVGSIFEARRYGAGWERSIMHCQGNAGRSEMQDSETNVLKGSISVAGGSEGAGGPRQRGRIGERAGADK